MAVKKTLPSTLAFCRGVEPSEGLMRAIKVGADFKSIDDLFAVGNWKKSDVRIVVEGVRGLVGNYADAHPSTRLGTGDKALDAPNPSRGERAALPADADRLLVECNLRFNASGTEACMNNMPDFGRHIANFVAGYAKNGGYQELAKRYFLRAASGSWTWRNRIVGDDLQVRVELGGESVSFGPNDWGSKLDSFDIAAILDQGKREKAEAMIDKIAKALAGGPDARSATMKCAALMTMGAGAEVYPSQEFVTESSKGVAPSERVGKILSKMMNIDGSHVATIHARKIGNAIRTIDSWHGAPSVGPIAVEMFGANSHQSVAHRVAGNDFYSYFKKVEELAKEVEVGIKDEHHYVAACLIRGGVFGFGGK